MKTPSHRRSPVRARVLAGSLLLAVTGAVVAAPAASAVPRSHASPVSPAQPGRPAPGKPPAGVVSWSVAPASATGVDSRTRFVYQNIKPGTFIFDHVAVFNRSLQAAAFSIYATDATGTAADGALTLLPANARSRGIGAWTTISGHKSLLSVIIPGGKGIIESFTIRVPFRATPGDHIGGMIAAVGVPRRTASGTLVMLYQRIAVPMELRVTGRLFAGLTVQGVSLGLSNPFNPFGGGSARVTYTVVNTGNVLLSGTQSVTITGPFGGISAIKAPPLPTVLPGDSIQYTVSAGGLYPAGTVAAHVTVTPKWPSDATPLPVTLASASASSSLFAFPWALLVLIIILAGGGYGSLRLVRSRRRAHLAEIAAVADRARRETERRLLGGASGKSSAKPGTSGKPPARPGASGKPPGAPGTGGKPPGAPGTSGKPPGAPGTSGRPGATVGTSRKPPATVGASGKPGAAPATNGKSSATPGTNGKPAANGNPATQPSATAAPNAAAAAVKPATEPAPNPATNAPVAPATETATEAAATPAEQTATTTPTGTQGGAGQPE